MLKQTADRLFPRAIDQERRREWRAGLWALGVAALFSIAGMVVDVLSYVTEMERAGAVPQAGQMLFGELTSRLVIIGLMVPMIMLVIRLPLTVDSWRVRLPYYVAAGVAFSVVHILLMVLLRKLFWPFLFEGSYDFVTHHPFITEFLYEFRKDIVTFAILITLIYAFKNHSDLRQELQAAKHEAAHTHRLVLKCGGRQVFLNASSVEAAQAAGNYVEVMADGQVYLARMTLAALAERLALAKVPVIRTHRSWLVNEEHIREVRAAGEGQQTVILASGEKVPVSRRYRPLPLGQPD